MRSNSYFWRKLQKIHSPLPLGLGYFIMLIRSKFLNLPNTSKKWGSHGRSATPLLYACITKQCPAVFLGWWFCHLATMLMIRTPMHSDSDLIHRLFLLQSFLDFKPLILKQPSTLKNLNTATLLNLATETKEKAV